MSANEMITKIERLKEWEALIAEAQAEAETLKDEIKREMDARNTEELEAGHIVRIPSFFAVSSNLVGKFRLLFENLFVNSNPLSVWTHSTVIPFLLSHL